MKRYNLAILGSLVLMLTVGANLANAAGFNDDEAEGRLVNVRVVEVGEERISVMTREGVEHVIAVCQIKTQVRRGKQFVHCKDLRVDDIVTVMLDAEKPVKFAKNIEVRDLVAENQP